MTREEFIKNTKVNDGTPGGGPISFNAVQKSTMDAFHNVENFILMSPRQSGRTLAILINVLYELHSNDCQDTIIVIRDIANVSIISQKFMEILNMNPFMTGIKTFMTETKTKRGMIKNNYNQKVQIKTPEQAKNIPLKDRENKRLILLDGAFVDDKTPIFNLIQGWYTVIIETVPGPMNKFNSLFIKSLVDFKGLKIFKVIKHQWQEIFDENWFSEMLHIFDQFGMDSKIFKREILLEWS